MGLLDPIHAFQTLAAIIFGCLLLRHLTNDKGSNPNGLPLPPGPKGYPLIGNLFDMPLYKVWLVYDEWFKTYGDMIYLNVLGQHFLILGSKERTYDLFDKRSSNYSDRMHTPMATELMRWDFAMGFQPYNAWWRKHRKAFHGYFHPNVVSKYLPAQKQSVHGFLRRLLATPDDFFHHIEHTFASSIMKITYGIDIKETDDPYVHLAKESLGGLNEVATPGAFWVDVFPFLKHVPSWFPGAGFQKKAAYWRGVNADLTELPFRHVEEQLKTGKAPPSIVSNLIDRLPAEDDPERPMEVKIAQNVAIVAYLGGADTTVATVKAMLLAMVLHPEVQKKAQAELDAVIGPNRLPDFEDRSSLPYINAVVKESMRWHSVTPLGLAHKSTNDDEYDGYFIPKGTVVFANGWSILHSSRTFDNPMEYKPERYLKDGKLNPDILDPNTVSFGFGRRICPGRHLSDNGLYAIASCFLAVYDIKPPVDDHGNVIKLKPEFTSGLMSSPEPFKCIISPRTPAAEALINGTALNEDN
ncbi:cytochrome P450 [Phlegmacium glaucopus]|nr:cytochrome P450 [Phlegmacium glaucopus]